MFHDPDFNTRMYALFMKGDVCLCIKRSCGVRRSISYDEVNVNIRQFLEIHRLHQGEGEVLGNSAVCV